MTNEQEKELILAMAKFMGYELKEFNTNYLAYLLNGIWTIYNPTEKEKAWQLNDFVVKADFNITKSLLNKVWRVNYFSSNNFYDEDRDTATLKCVAAKLGVGIS